MDDDQRAMKIVDEMIHYDAFSQWLGIEVLEVRQGYARIGMTVRDEMVNGFLIAHGGITFSLADSAFAFASNGHGVKSVSIECSISHLEAVSSGDQLMAEAKEIKKANRVGWYHVDVTNQDEVLVAKFEGTVYRTHRPWEV